MTPSLTNAERRVLEAAEAAERSGCGSVELTDVVRRETLPHVTGDDFRNAVATLATRRLLRARVTTKAHGVVGRVAIDGITALGRVVIGRPRRDDEP